VPCVVGRGAASSIPAVDQRNPSSCSPAASRDRRRQARAACRARCTSTQPNNGLRRPEQGERVEAAPNPLAIVSKIVRASDGTEAIRFLTRSPVSFENPRAIIELRGQRRCRRTHWNAEHTPNAGVHSRASGYPTFWLTPSGRPVGAVRLAAPPTRMGERYASPASTSPVRTCRPKYR
jgi:hypothetical protein